MMAIYVQKRAFKSSPLHPPHLVFFLLPLLCCSLSLGGGRFIIAVNFRAECLVFLSRHVEQLFFPALTSVCYVKKLFWAWLWVVQTININKYLEENMTVWLFSERTIVDFILSQGLGLPQPQAFEYCWYYNSPVVQTSNPTRK